MNRTDWETMAQHEERVAERCRRFLARIDPALEAWGDVLGRWHDLGKYSSDFQRYLDSANGLAAEDVHRGEMRGRVDHSTAAAKLAIEKFSVKGRLLSYCFAGHHAGLPDWDDGETQRGLKQRSTKEIPDWQANAPKQLTETAFPPIPAMKPVEKHEADVAAFRVALLIRIVFSGLVDADFLATEEFMSPDRQQDRVKNHAGLEDMANVLESAIQKLELGAKPSRVNSIRKAVAASCQKRASLPPGFFSLCVPTGGGKTIASLRFALNHAKEHGLERVIVAVPFTSIIEQNSKVYRNIFAELGSEVVLEHHSNLDPADETTTNRLQAENWDAPLVVTTNVQLFESLFACRTSKCRKLHRIPRSVIVLDEAQTLPIELLQPTLYALRELVESYGCSVILCSATQPALNWRDDFPIGLKYIRPIVEDINSLHETLKRTAVTQVGKLTNDQLAQELLDEEQALCIVNTRPHAAAVFEMIRNAGDCFHLSTRMCAAHRLAILDEIRDRLNHKQPCRVISTQLIEAGVDVDFPVVYRASCGLDSLAQAAGRCNREGLLDIGRVVFFDAEQRPPPGFLRQSADSAAELLEDFDDLLSPAAIEAYFQLHYWKKSDAWDNYQVLAAIGSQPNKLEFNFRQVADRYKFIRDESETILVGWGDAGAKLLSRLEHHDVHIHRDVWRRLQRYGVQVRQHELAELQRVGAVEKMHERWVLVQQHLYDDELGLRFSKADGVLPVEDLIF